MVAFVYVCLKVMAFPLVFASQDSIEPIRYGVCLYMYVGCRDEFVADGSFVC